MNRLSFALAGAVCILGLFVIAGWWLGIELLVKPLPGHASMNPLTALLFILAPISLMLIVREKNSRRERISGLLIAFFIFLIGAVKVLSAFLNFDMQLDHLLFSSKTNMDLTNGLANRMSPNTAFCFMLSGASLLFLRDPLKRSLSQYFACLIAFIALLSVLGYLYNVRFFYRFMSLMPMALNTALGFLLFSMAVLLAFPKEGIMKEFTLKYSGSSMARSLIPAAIIVPSLLGLLWLEGEKRGVFSPESGTALLVVSIITIFIFLIHNNAVLINRRDEARDLAENRLSDLNESLECLVKERTNELQLSEKIYRTIAASIPNSSIAIIDQDERCLMLEGQLLTRLKSAPERIIGRKASEVMTEEEYSKAHLMFQRVLNGEQFSFETSQNNIDLQIQFVPFLDDQELEMAMILATDISEIKKAQKEIISMNASLERKVDQRTEQLQVANKELESFSYSISHDLRAPLRAISGYANIVSSDYATDLPDDGKGLIKEIQNNASMMSRLIDNLLSFASLGNKALNRTDVNMKELFNDAITDFEKIERHKASIQISTLHPAKADYPLLRQVVYNLISNAVKYSGKKENPVIEVGSQIKGHNIEYYIRDNGAGFNMDYEHKLFGVFQRLHSPEEFEGTGVGLAIVQRIINKHGGKVWAEGEVNKGATFYFSLPIE